MYWKKNRIAVTMGLLLMILIWNVNTETLSAGGKQNYEIDSHKLYAQSAVLMDADSGRILFAKNGQEQRPMASTTKIMTLIVTLENADINDTVTVSEYAASMPDVQLNIRKGEQYQLKDLLYSLMLESHNDSAVAIAEHVGGNLHQSPEASNASIHSIEESKEAVANFCKMMNQKARDIGCYHTCFLTPNGLDATMTETSGNAQEQKRAHGTTAEDLARIMRYCITQSPRKDLFVEITGTLSYTFQEKEGKRNFSCTNHNALLQMLEGAISGKTGYTSKAGYCYVGCVESGDRIFVVSLLGCGWPSHKDYKWRDMKYLIHCGEEQYERCNLSEIPIDKSAVEHIVVEQGKTEHLGETAYVEVQMGNPEKKETGMGTYVLKRKDEQVEISYERENILQAPVNQGDVVGMITYQVGNEVWKKVPIIASENVEKIDFLWCLRKVTEFFSLRHRERYATIYFDIQTINQAIGRCNRDRRTKSKRIYLYNSSSRRM